MFWNWVDSINPGQVHVWEIIPRGISLGHGGHSPRMTVDWLTQDIPFTLLFYTLLQRKPAQVTIDISGRQPLATTKNLLEKYHFPPLSYVSVLEKRLILEFLFPFWFSFSGLQVKIPASCPWLLFVSCISYSAVAGLQQALLQKPTSQRLATVLTPPTGHHLSPGYRCHLQCFCTTEEGPCLATEMLEHTSGKR